MNVAQLLADLQGRSYIEWVGPWVLDAEPRADGARLYTAITRQTVGGNAASYIGVQAVVLDEGGPGETAFYLNVPPDQKPRTSIFMDQIVAAIDASPDTLKGIQILAVNERWSWAIYTTLEASGGDLVQTAWYWRAGQTPLKIQNFNPELLGSLLKV